MNLLLIFIHRLRLGRIWHKVNFLSGVLTGLNSEFSFSLTCYLTKAEEPSLSYYWIHTFPKAICAMWNAISLVQDLSLLLLRPRVPVGPPSTPDKQNEVAVQATRTCGIEVSGKRGKRWEVGTTLSPHKLEEVLPVMKAKVNGMDRIALVDSGCSSSVVSRMLCRPEVQKRTAILTAGRKCLLSHGVGSIILTVTNRNPLKTNVLVVNSKPLGFDLLLGIDIIKKLGGVHIDEGGKAHFVEAAHT